jgi:indolepyruvate ferredoxin oxidoreductase alpha subunit
MLYYGYKQFILVCNHTRTSLAGANGYEVLPERRSYMPIQLLMGNEAIALGALGAGVSVACGYPGTPSTEILESLARLRTPDVHVEWSVNEKAALEVAAGASYAGLRSLVTMKQVGLNVASDPLMSLAYVGIKGGMVIVVADDPGPISSQTEQDTRTFARYAKLPCFDPSSPEQAYTMIADAFALSERWGTPVLFRPTTRLCHATAGIDTDAESAAKGFFSGESGEIAGGFEKDPRWVIFPALSFRAHGKIELRNRELAERLSDYPGNFMEGEGLRGIVTGGVSYAYVKEALALLRADCKILKIGTPHPFPRRLAQRFLETVTDALIVEELDPYLEHELRRLQGDLSTNVGIIGKDTDDMPLAGENTVEALTKSLAKYLSLEAPAQATAPTPPPLPVRPPVLCAGCPHRASFYAVKKAMHGKKAIFSGDIGCYTLGNAAPLHMVDTCLCMGAGITLAQGLSVAEPGATNFAFIGDSTFFASGLTGVVNAVYNKHDLVLVVLDNSITAMTGGQPHPGIGKTLMGEPAPRLSIPDILRAFGVSVHLANPLEHASAVALIQAVAAEDGVRAIVFESPCVNIIKPARRVLVRAEACIGCGICKKELGCPALMIDNKQLSIDDALCTGCGLCAQICPKNAIDIDDMNDMEARR